MKLTTQTWQNLLDVDDLLGQSNVLDRTSHAIQSQYDASPRIKGIGSVVQDEISATKDLETVCNGVVNVQPAKGVFLDGIARRVGLQNREVVLDGEIRNIDDDPFRFLILYKASANIANASIGSLNDLLTQLIGRPVFVVDNQDMTISVRIFGEPDPMELAILKTFGFLTRGSGVGWNIIIQNPANKIFGFKGSNLHPFNIGSFNESKVIEE